MPPEFSSVWNKNTIYLNDNVNITYAKYLLHPPYGFEIFENFTEIYALCRAGIQPNSAIYTKVISNVEDYQRNISEKYFLNIPIDPE